MEFSGIQWNPVEFTRIDWNDLVEFRGLQWNPTEIPLKLSLNFQLVPLDSTELHYNPLNATELLRKVC